MNGRETEDRSRVRHEPEGTPALLITAALAGTVFAGALLVAGAFLWLHALEGRVRPSRVFDEKSLHLRGRVSEVLQEPFDIPSARPKEREQQERGLDEFGWVDRRRRIVRIPIEEAMQLIAEGRAPQGAGR